MASKRNIPINYWAWFTNIVRTGCWQFEITWLVFDDLLIKIILSFEIEKEDIVQCIIKITLFEYNSLITFNLFKLKQSQHPVKKQIT